MMPDNQSEHWDVWPEGPHTLLSSVNGQLNIVLACPHTLHTHRAKQKTLTDQAGEGNIAVQTLRCVCGGRR